MANLSKKRLFLVWLAFVAILFGVYGGYANNPFIGDDYIQVLENRHIQSLEHWPSYFTSSTMGSGGAKEMGGIYYKPLMTLYYAVVWALAGAETWAYRAPLILLQATNAFLVCLLSLEFVPLAWAISLGMLFQLHPVNSELILYIADAQDILYFFFGLLTLVTISRTDRSPAPLSRAQELRAGLALALSFSCALLSKETGVLFLPIAAIWAWLMHRKSLRATLISGVAVGIAYAGVRLALGLTHVENSNLLFHQAGFWQRLSMVPLILGHYIEILLAPIRISMSTDWVIHELTLLNFALPLVLILLAFYFLLAQLRPLAARNGFGKLFDFHLGVLSLWFFLHGQVFVPLDSVYADRWLVLPCWSVLSMAFMAAKPHEMSRKTRVLIATVIGVALAGYVARDVIRAETWQSPLELYAREASLHPGDAVMTNNVGVELFKQGQWKEAEPYFVRATELNPAWNVAWNNRGAVLERHQRYDEALAFYQRSFEVGTYPLAIENYGKLLCALGRLDECRKFVSQVLPYYPFNSILQELARGLKVLPPAP